MVRRQADENPIDLPPPAKTVEGREDQLAVLAYDLAEKRLAQGTASAQEVVYALRVGSSNTQLINEKLRGENEVLRARVVEMESRASSEELMAEALEAFRGYSGQRPVDPDEDEWDDQY